MALQQFIDATVKLRYGILVVTEIILSVTVFFSVVYFGFNAAQSFLLKDWSSMSVMHEFISFILLIILGLEVARLILVHSITVVMELMLLIIARKMLHPEIVAIDLLFTTVAFALIVGIFYLYELKPIKSLDDLTK